MTLSHPVTIKVDRLPEDRDAFYKEPENVLCSSSGKLAQEERKITAGELWDIIASIKANSDDTQAMVNRVIFIMHDIASGAQESPKDGGEMARIIQKHTPDYLWPSVHYFWPGTNWTIQWYVAEDNAQIQDLLERKVFELKII